jgi:hypothetical protein
MKRAALARRAGSTAGGVKTRARVDLLAQAVDEKERITPRAIDARRASECTAQSRVKAA